MTVAPTQVVAGSAGNTLTFTYTAANGMSSGQLAMTVPSGWSPPTTGTGAGATTSTCGTVGVSTSTIQVTGVTLSSGQQCTITYTGTAPTPGGTTSTFTTQQESTSDNDLLDLTESPVVTVTTPPSEKLTVSVHGHGHVSGDGLSCPTTCSKSFPKGTSVSLTAHPATGYRFSGWSGSCHGTGACKLTLNSNSAVTATFVKIPPACVVPRLKGKTLAQARTLLSKAHCTLGKVTRPRHVTNGQKLVVGSTRPGAGTKLPQGAKVAVTLVKKR
jgi:hypothetical protein